MMAGQGFSISDLHWGLALDLVYLAFAALLFHRMFESARERGLLIRAE